MKCFVLLAILVVAVHGRLLCPSDLTEGIDCFETNPDQLFCMTDGNLVCGTCGMRLAFCLGLDKGVIIIETNDPTVCEGATPPECPNTQHKMAKGKHGNPFGIPPGMNKPKNCPGISTA